MIDYRTTPFETVAKDMDVVFDTVGGETLERSWGVLKSGGRLVTVATGSSSSADQRVRQAFFVMQPNRAQLLEIARLIDTQELRPPPPAAVFWLAQAREAYARAQQGHLGGKIALRVREEPAQVEAHRKGCVVRNPSFCANQRLKMITERVVNVGGFAEPQREFLEFHRTNVFLKREGG